MRTLRAGRVPTMTANKSVSFLFDRQHDGEKRREQLTDRSGKSRPDHEQCQIDKHLFHQHLLCPDDGKSNHDKTQAKDGNQSDLLSQSDLDVIDQPQGHSHNCFQHLSALPSACPS